jgi:hypothetical protein
MKKMSCLLTLVLMLVPVAQLAAQTQKNAESAKKNIARLGVGKKAKTTITLNDRSKVNGYVYSVGDDDFVVRDNKTDSPTTVRYADVLSVNDRSSKDLLIGLGAAAAGAAILILVVTRGAALRPH